MSEWFKSFIKIHFSNFKCVRRWCGGKWEQWYPECCGPVWLQVKEFTRLTGRRPGGCFYGGMIEEDYTSTSVNK